MDMENAVICEKPHTVPKKKRKRCTDRLNNLNNSIDVCHDYPHGTTLVDDIPLKSPVSISTGLVPLKVEDTTMEPAVTTSNDLVCVPKKKKKKKPKSGSNNANIVDDGCQDGASSKSVVGINGKTCLERSTPNTDLSCSKKKKKKKKRKKKKNANLEVAGSNATDAEESSLTTEQQSGLLVTENTGSLEVDHVLLGIKSCSGNSCPGDTITTSLETIPLGEHGVSTLTVEDIMTEKDSANSPGIIPTDKEKKKRKKKKKRGSKDRICGLNDVNVSEGHLEKKNGIELDEVHITRDDASNIEEDSSCKGNGSDNLSGGDPLCKPLEVDNILQEKGPAPDLDVLNDDVNLDTSVKEGKLSQIDVSPERAVISHARKKLLILDVNGLLVDFVPYMPNGYKPDIMISKKAVFKRPYCDEFLQFCFEKFNVGVWSSRTKKNIDSVVNFLMQDSKHKLLFCWDQSHCTMTGFHTIENRNKPLVLKELKKLWEKLEPDLPWERGDYDQTNTLLLDDSPYKALRNPVNTAIFPYSYDYRDFKDTSLGPGGDLRIYLEKLAMAENVQNFVEQNPFGQEAITKSNPRWNFYCKILEPHR